MNSDIYISASRKDYEVVSKIKSILHSAGYTYFHEMESFEPGKFKDQNIRAEILEAKLFLCILSENSYTSYYIQKEIRFALKEKGEKQVIPIVIDYAYPLEEIESVLFETSPIRLDLYDIASAEVILLHEIKKRYGKKESEILCGNDVTNIRYDVFISCKSEDYPFARKVYQFLREQNYNVFLADTELRKKGNAEYGEIIDEALDSATHMVIVATKPGYIMSTYVKSEWRTFIEEKRSGRKIGNIVTLIEFSISELPISLRHFQSFSSISLDCITDFLPIDTDRDSL